MSSDLRTVLRELVRGKGNPGLAWDIGGVLVSDKASAVGLCILTDPTIEEALGPWDQRLPEHRSSYERLLQYPMNMHEENAVELLGLHRDVFRAARERALVDPVNLPRYLQTNGVELDVVVHALRTLPPGSDGIANVGFVSTAEPEATRALYNTINPQLAKRGVALPISHYCCVGKRHKDDTLIQHGYVGLREDHPNQKVRDPSRFYLGSSPNDMRDAVDVLAEILTQRERAA